MQNRSLKPPSLDDPSAPVGFSSTAVPLVGVVGKTAVDPVGGGGGGGGGGIVVGVDPARRGSANMVE